MTEKENKITVDVLIGFFVGVSLALFVVMTANWVGDLIIKLEMLNK